MTADNCIICKVQPFLKPPEAVAALVTLAHDQLISKQAADNSTPDAAPLAAHSSACVLPFMQLPTVS
jgi:hypothetical protein